VLKGYLPKSVPARTSREPIVLEHGAALRVKLVDATSGKAPSEAKVELKYASGKTLGPFPANAFGLALPTLPPGAATVVVSATGYRPASSEPFVLEARREREVEVRLVAEPGPASKGKPGN
jgi:hypothetical protein